MQRDLKIGFLVGLILTGAAMFYICTRPSLSPKARILKAAQQKEDEPIQTEQQVSTVLDSSRLSNYANYPEEETHTFDYEQTQQSISNEDTAGSDENLVAEPKPEFAAPQSQPEQTSHIQSEKIKATRFYIVRRGDSLSRISKIYYGTTSNWSKIYRANRNVLGNNPDMLKPGTKLIIPD